MPRAPLSEEQIEAFRTRAVSLATKLFAERGYEAVSMRALAGELGCSPMTPYRYFKNHEELISRVRTEAFRRFADKMQRCVHTEQCGADKLRSLKKAYIQFALEEANSYRIMFELGQESEEFDSDTIVESTRSFSPLHQATVQAVEEGTLAGDPLSLAHIFWANTHGLVMLELAGKLTMNRSIEDLAAMDERIFQ